MDFDFTSRQRSVYELVGELGRDNFLKRAAEYDRAAELPLENLKELGELGLFALTVSSDLGGSGSGVKGFDPLLYLLAIEQVARYDTSTAQCLHIHCHGSHYIDQWGTPEQRQDVLTRVVEEGLLLNGTGSEPGRSARGLYGLQTTADRVEGGYVLNGVKNYATLAEIVGFNSLHANIRGLPPVDGNLGFLIPHGADGLRVVPDSWNPMGMRAAVSPTLELTECFVPDSHVLGPPGNSVRQRWQAKCHLGFAAQYLGATVGIFDALQEYLPQRGTTSDPYTQLHVGEIRVGIESARWMIYRAAWLWTQGDDPAAELYAMEAKHRSIDNAVLVMDRASQIAGSSAFLDDSRLARTLRDLRFHTLHEHLDRTGSTIGQAYLGETFDTTARL